MADALVSFLLNELATVIRDEIQQEVRLVVGVEDEISKLTKTFMAIQLVLKDADVKQFKDESVKHWLEEFKDVAYDMDDILDEWRTEMLIKSQIKEIQNAPNDEGKKKVHSLLRSFCSCFGEVELHLGEVGLRLGEVVLRHDIGGRIKEIRERVDSIANEKDKYQLIQSNNDHSGPDRIITSSLIDESVVYGRNFEKDIIISKLLGGSDGSSSSSQQETGLSHPTVISIVGMGGLGKTTLAQLVINDEQVKNHFDKTMWVCVSDPFHLPTLAQAIIKEAGGDVPSNPQWNELHNSLSKSVTGKQFMLVLDDVWTEDPIKWERLELGLKSCAPGSRILVTTRNQKVAKIMNSTNIYDLEILSDIDCWSLISGIAFFGRDEQEQETLNPIGFEIAKKCKGLPLAAKALGSLLRFKNTESDWENVLKSEIWEIEEVENNFLKPALLLSYFDLPSSLKPCFTYCSIFPKDYEMEKDVLIKLWMAQGFLNSAGKRRDDLESIGEEYFNNLVLRSFFQDIEFENGKISWCKMHDLLHDFAQFFMENECLISTRNDTLDYNKIRHLPLIRSSCNTTISEAKNLRTLQLSVDEELPSSFFGKFRCLRVLCLQDGEFENLSSEIGTLIHLRYLDLSCNRQIKELPESITTLYNLQTLNLTECEVLCKLPEEMWKLNNLRYLDLSHNWDLKELPESITTLYNLQTLNLANSEQLCKLPDDMWKLNNLRHLDIEGCASLEYLPQGIGKLTCLRTLNFFPLSGVTQGSAKIQELKDLNHLEGELEIRWFGNVKTTKSEASEARLKNKNHLRVLELNFGWIGDDEKNSLTVANRMNGMLEGLEPPTKLERLVLRRYFGSKFPSWIEDKSILSNLKDLDLLCFNCIEIPALGRLPSLEKLVIWSMKKIKQIGLESYRPPAGTCGGVMRGETLFPKLKELYLADLDNLEELFGNGVAAEEGDIIIEIMPFLVKLEIDKCPKLKSFPALGRLPSLEKLKIGSMEQIKQIGVMRGETLFPKLKELYLADLDNLEELFGNGVAAAEELLGDMNIIEIMPCLIKLEIYKCPKLKSLPRKLVNLEQLEYDDSSSPSLSPFPSLPKLKCLHIRNSKVARLSQGLLAQFQGLEKLKIVHSHNLICIPEEVKQLTNLQELRIQFCGNLICIPEEVKHLTNLQELRISWCEKLSQRCRKDEGEDWSIISHIPNIFIDRKKIQ